MKVSKLMEVPTCVVSGGGESSVVALVMFSGSEIALHSMMSSQHLRNAAPRNQMATYLLPCTHTPRPRRCKAPRLS